MKALTLLHGKNRENNCAIIHGSIKRYWKVLSPVNIVHKNKIVYHSWTA